MNGRSRMDKYQSLRQEVANSTDASSENFDMRKDNSNIGYNGYHSNGSHVSLRSANSDDTANLPTTFPKTSTTDYDEMLREQEEFLKSLEEQFDNFRNTGSFSTIRENTADLTETVAEVMPEPVEEEPIIPEEISIETIEPENEPVEEIAPVEVEEVEVPELNITEPENIEEVKAEPEKPVIEVAPIEVEQVELETLMPADDRSEFTAPELVEFEMPEVKVEEPIVLQEKTQEVIEKPEVQEEIVQETVEEPETEEEPHQEIETAEVEAEEAIVTEEPVGEEGEQEPEVNEQFDFDNPQAFKEEEQKEDFQEILDKLTVEDDVVDNTYMSLDMPWLDKNTNEPFEFFKEEEPVVEEPVKEEKPVIELPKVSSVFGPTAGIVHTGYYDSTHDLYSYNDYLKPQKTEAEPKAEEVEPEVTEPQEITEPAEKEETQDVTVVTNDAEEQMYHEELEEYADILPHISAEYTPVEYQEEEFVPLVKETVETFEPEVIEEVVSDEEMNQYEDYEPVSQEPVRLEVNVEEPQQISVEEIETAEVEAEETPVIEEPVVEESVQEPEAVKESVLPEIEEFTEEDISAILDDYAPDFGKDGDYDIPERSEFTDTFTDVLNQTFAEEKNDAAYDDIDSLDADELMKQENIDDELYKEIVEDAARDFSEDEIEEHEENWTEQSGNDEYEEMQLDLDGTDEPEQEAEEETESETERECSDDGETENEEYVEEPQQDSTCESEGEECLVSTVDNQQLEIADENSAEECRQEEDQELMNYDDQYDNEKKENPEYEVSFDDIFVADIDSPVEEYYGDVATEEVKEEEPSEAFEAPTVEDIYTPDELTEDLNVDEFVSDEPVESEEVQPEEQTEEVVEQAEEVAEESQEVGEVTEEFVIPNIEISPVDMDMNLNNVERAVNEVETVEIPQIVPDVIEPETEPVEETQEQPGLLFNIETPDFNLEAPKVDASLTSYGFDEPLVSVNLDALNKQEEVPEVEVQEEKVEEEQFADVPVIDVAGIEEPSFDFSQPTEEINENPVEEVAFEYAEPETEPQQEESEEPAYEETYEETVVEQPEEVQPEYEEPAEAPVEEVNEPEEQPQNEEYFEAPAEEAVEEPVVEETTVEEPVVEQPEEVQPEYEEPAEAPAEEVSEPEEQPQSEEYFEAPAEEAVEEPVVEETTAEEPVIEEAPVEEQKEEELDLPFEHQEEKKYNIDDLGVNVRPFNVERPSEPALDKTEFTFNTASESKPEVPEFDFSVDDELDEMSDIFTSEPLEDSYNDIDKILNDVKSYNIEQGIRNDEDTQVNIISQLKKTAAINEEVKQETPVVEEPAKKGGLFSGFFAVNDNDEEDGYEEEVKPEVKEEPVAEPVKEAVKEEETVYELDDEPEQEAAEETEAIASALASMKPYTDEYSLEDDYYELDSTPVVTADKEPELKPQLQPAYDENKEHLTELTQKIEMERELRQEMFEQTQQLKLQVSEYENELNDVNNNMSRTNRILNVVLTLLIIALFVIIIVIGFFFAQERGLIG